MPKGVYSRSSASDRFNRMVEMTDGCHLWKGPLSSSGYANFWFEGRYVGAHVYAWIRVHGPIEPGVVIRHGPCHTRHCVNVEHLTIGTKADNNRDRERDGTQTYGSSHHSSVLTEEQVMKAKELHSLGVTWVRIAADLGVKPGTIRDAATHRRGVWRRALSG